MFNSMRIPGIDTSFCGVISDKFRHRSSRTDLWEYLFRNHIILDLASGIFVFLLLSMIIHKIV